MFKNLSTDGLGITGRQSEIIELALSFGFKGIDLDIVDLSRQVDVSGLPHARRMLDSSRLKYGAFRLPIDFDADEKSYREALAVLPKYVQVAKEMKCLRAVAAIAPGSNQRPYHDNFELHRRRLVEVAGALEVGGIRLGLELDAAAESRKNLAFQFIFALDGCAALLGMVRAKNVGLVLDQYQMHLAGLTIEDVQKTGPAGIVAVYLSDAPADAATESLTAENRLLPGETGALNAAALLASLGEIGYDGPVTPRVGTTQAAGLRRDALVKLAAERLDAAWKAAGLSPAGKLSPTAGAK